jgi:transposase InsO family protein
LAVDGSSVPEFSLVDSLLKYKNRIWVGNDHQLQLKILTAFHSSAVGGHSGISVTYHRVKKLFAWKGLKSAVQEFEQSCIICQQSKLDRAKSPGLLQPLPTPDGAWQMMTMDFVEGLPKSGAANCILVVVDKFTKYGHFIPLHHPYTVVTVAKACLDNVYKLHGMPLSIVSDRDRIFTSRFWQELFRRAQVQLRMSSSYHPQSDGQTECVNQCMETYL